MDDNQKQLIEVYRSEVADLLDELAQSLEMLLLEGETPDSERMSTAFRAAHSIKGGARVVGLGAVEQLAHAIEDGLSPYQRGGSPSRPLLELLLESVVVLARLVEGQEAETPDQLIGRIRGASKDTLRGERASPQPSNESTADTGRSTIRVETTRLDHLMACTGELLATQAQLAARVALVAELGQDFDEVVKKVAGESRASLLPLIKRLDEYIQLQRKDHRGFEQLTDEMGAAVKQVRMQPLRGVASSWRRIIRQCAHDVGKKVALELDVGDIELDKQIIERLGDPFLHLLRNAIDHGLETPQERASLGKSAVGTIVIGARMVGAMVQIEVGDDGRGLDLEKIGRTALETGMVANQSDVNVRSLLFTPGFSTADEVGHLSGRGVGLDVVHQRVTELGGTVEVHSEPSSGGTTFYLTIPMSVLSTKGLIVRAGRSVCALPIDHVVRSMRVDRSTVQQADGSSAIIVEGSDPVRLFSLAELFSEAKQHATSKLNVVVLSWAGIQLGIVVEEVLGEQEFVTKRLPWNLRHVAGVNGAVIRGDGTVAVVLDVPHLFSITSQQGNLDEVRLPQTSAKPCILVVDDSLTSRTLERNILTAAGFEVIVATDGEEGWGRLQEHPVAMAVIDVQMPRLNGFDLTRRIRADERLKNLPVVLVTSLESPEDVREGAAAGADEYIIKGRFDQRELLEAVARLT